MTKSADARPVFIYFGGTGSHASSASERGDTPPASFKKIKAERRFKMTPNTIRIYVDGCQHPRVGGKDCLGELDPDLDVGTNNLESSFNGSILNLNTLKENFGDAISIAVDGAEPNTINVSKLVISGFSRGSVHCLSAAIALNDTGIPMHVFAHDPVPGESKEKASQQESLFQQHHDLRKISNLQTLTLSLGRYFKNIGLQNRYFRQMLPLVGEHTKTTVFATNRSHHLHRFNPFVLCELETFLRNLGIVSSENYTTKKIAPFAPMMLRIPNHLILRELHGGDLRKIPDPPSQIKLELEAINSFLRNNTVNSNTHYAIRKALYRMSVRSTEKPNTDLISLLLKNKNACKCLVQLESFIFQNTRKNNLTKAVKHQLIQALHEIDAIVLKALQGNIANATDYFYQIKTCVDQSLRPLPTAIQANVQPSIRSYLSTNPLKLSNDLSEQQSQTIQRNRCHFAASLTGTLMFVATSSSGYVAAGILLMPVLSSPSTYGSIMVLAAVLMLGATILASAMTDQYHPRHWTLSQQKQPSSQLKQEQDLAT